MDRAGKVPGIGKKLDHRHGTEPEPMTDTLRVVVRVHKRGDRRSRGSGGGRLRRRGRDLDSSPDKVRTDAAGCILRMLHVSGGITPDTECPVDVLLPKSLGRVGNLRVWGRVII